MSIFSLNSAATAEKFNGNILLTNFNGIILVEKKQSQKSATQNRLWWPSGKPTHRFYTHTYS